MRVLAIDTSSPAGSIALLSDGETLALQASESEETYSSRLFRELRLLLEAQKLRLRDLDLYAVASGPGSFTGLRVGLSAVKAFAEIHGKPIAAISVLEAVAAASGLSGVVAAVVDARRGQLYGGVYDLGREVTLCGEEIVAVPEELLERLEAECGTSPLRVATPTPEAIAAWLPADATLHSVTQALAEVIGRRGLERHRRGETISALELDANYIRRSDAELLWKRK